MIRKIPWNLRNCQAEPLRKWIAATPSDFLAILTPGAGKTRFGHALSHALITHASVPRVIIFVPTENLKHHWAQEFHRSGIELNPTWNGTLDDARPYHGLAITYAQLLQRSIHDALQTLANGALIINDEIHHASTGNAWGKTLSTLTEEAKHRLHLSGTPFRSDKTTIAHLSYDQRGIVVGDYTYGYHAAITDGICRAVVCFPQAFQAVVERPDGTILHVDIQSKEKTVKRALDSILRYNPYAGTLIDRAHTTLLAIRKRHPNAGGMVAAIDSKHAEQLVDLTKSITGTQPLLALSNETLADPDAIDRFRYGTQPWIVAVGQIAEGTDIPRLRIQVQLTTTRTTSFFRQLVGRIVRHDGIHDGPSYLYLPADPRGMELAHHLRAEVPGSAESHIPGALTEPDITLADIEAEEEEADREKTGRPQGTVLNLNSYALSPMQLTTLTIDPNDLFDYEEPPEDADDGIPMYKLVARLREKRQELVKDVAQHFHLKEHDINARLIRMFHKGVDELHEQQLRKQIAVLARALNTQQLPRELEPTYRRGTKR